MTRFAFPYRVGPDGRTGNADRDRYIRGLIEQILFTRQGERTMRPDFGAGIHDVLFTENAPELAASIQHMAKAALQRWLAEIVELKEVVARAEGARLEVTVRYRALEEAEMRVFTVAREV